MNLPNDRRKCVDITIIDDDILEDVESFTLSLISESTTDTISTIITEILIVDDDGTYTILF